MTDADRVLDLAKRGGDAAAVTTAFGGLVTSLPTIATALSIVYVLIRIWESATVQRLVDRVRGRAGGGADDA